MASAWMVRWLEATFAVLVGKVKRFGGQRSPTCLGKHSGTQDGIHGNEHHGSWWSRTGLALMFPILRFVVQFESELNSSYHLAISTDTPLSFGDSWSWGQSKTSGLQTSAQKVLLLQSLPNTVHFGEHYQTTFPWAQHQGLVFSGRWPPKSRSCSRHVWKGTQASALSSLTCSSSNVFVCVFADCRDQRLSRNKRTWM